jgi:hypothetical protein
MGMVTVAFKTIVPPALILIVIAGLTMTIFISPPTPMLHGPEIGTNGELPTDLCRMATTAHKPRTLQIRDIQLALPDSLPVLHSPRTTSLVLSLALPRHNLLRTMI